MIRFNCSCCGNQLEVPDDFAGQMVDCPYSGRKVAVLQLPEDNAPLASPVASPSASGSEPDPFDIANPFTDVRQPSAWEQIKERNARERRQRKQGLIALLIEMIGVVIAAGVGASIGIDFAALFAACRTAAIGATIGGAITGIFGALVITGAFRPAMYSPLMMAAMPAPSAPKGQPMVTPYAFIFAFCGILIGGIVGATLGAGSSHPNLDGGSILGRALFGGVIGTVPAVIWWVRARRRS